MTDRSRDGLPCWIGCDAHGVRAWSWQAVRLVEWLPVPPERPDLVGDTCCLALEDGSESIHAIAVPVLTDAAFVECVGNAITLAAFLHGRAATVPPC